MTQRDLNHAIARTTGESVREIELMGFSEVSPFEISESASELAIVVGMTWTHYWQWGTPDLGRR